MFKQILEVFIYIMGVYGIISLVYSLIRKLWENMGRFTKEGNTRLVLLVKDQEETIEGIIRSFYISRAIENKQPEHLYSFYGINNNNGIVVVDMGSEDKTLDILQKLKNAYGSLEVLSVNEKDRIFEGI